MKMICGTNGFKTTLNYKSPAEFETEHAAAAA
jgi:hypothetical protein